MAESHFWQALSDTIHRAVSLRIVTVAGDAQVQGALENLQVSAPAVFYAFPSCVARFTCPRRPRAPNPFACTRCGDQVPRPNSKWARRIEISTRREPAPDQLAQIGWPGNFKIFLVRSYNWRVVAVAERFVLGDQPELLA